MNARPKRYGCTGGANSHELMVQTASSSNMKEERWASAKRDGGLGQLDWIKAAGPVQERVGSTEPVQQE